MIRKAHQNPGLASSRLANNEQRALFRGCLRNAEDRSGYRNRGAFAQIYPGGDIQHFPLLPTPLPQSLDVDALVLRRLKLDSISLENPPDLGDREAGPALHPLLALVSQRRESRPRNGFL